MKTIAYLGALIAITTGLFTTGMQATASNGSDSSSDSDQAENATKHDSTGNWQTVLLKDGTECEGLVFESIEDAEAAAIEIGCSGYHEHHTEDGTVLYMPCDGSILDAEGVKAELLNALARGEITQEQVNEKLAWL
jgi:hypothetical protein